MLDSVVLSCAWRREAISPLWNTAPWKRTEVGIGTILDTNKYKMQNFAAKTAVQRLTMETDYRCSKPWNNFLKMSLITGYKHSTERMSKVLENSGKKKFVMQNCHNSPLFTGNPADFELLCLDGSRATLGTTIIPLNVLPLSRVFTLVGPNIKYLTCTHCTYLRNKVINFATDIHISLTHLINIYEPILVPTSQAARK